MKNLVAEIIGAEVTELRPLSSGGNSRLYCASAGAGRFLVKQYPPDTARPRLQTERLALEQLHAAGLPVPRFLGRAEGEELAVHEWIEGEPVGAATDEDIAAMTRMAHAAQEVANPQAFAPASAACLSLEDAITQVEERLRAGSTIADPRATEFVTKELAPRATATVRAARSLADRLALNLGASLPREKQILSLSDFGLHNALRRPDGSLVFLDFEYFGWDDPAKLIADSILHPGMSLVRRHKEMLAHGLRPLLDDERRLEIGLPLWKLCWCMILMNSFLPDRWRKIDADTAHHRLSEARRRVADLETPWNYWTNAPKT